MLRNVDYKIVSMVYLKMCKQCNMTSKGENINDDSKCNVPVLIRCATGVEIMYLLS